ncbi:MAG: hypothetical protein MSG64_07210 [Pyrinomonadaceae bacterium MAG19_C2-C3]|nr:hypothetical protein [Pyrinomonadaceae bacterium MAG19_C2-C3]
MTDEEMQKMVEFIIERQERFTENMEQADKRMNRLETAFVSMFNMVTENTKAIKELRVAQAETDERLNVFINVVERYITHNEGDNGEPQQS